MGGEGSMMAMITSLKNNKNLRRNRTRFDKDKLGGYGDFEKLEFNFPEATPQVLKEIRERLINERKIIRRKTIVVFISIVVVITAFILL